MEMPRLKLLMNIIIIVSSILLAASYFFPVEASWSPLDAWQGYWVGGELVTGVKVALVDIPSYATGLVVLAALILSRLPKLTFALITAFAAFWVFSLIWYLMLLADLPDVKYLTLWLSLAIVTVPFFVVVMVLASRKYGRNTSFMLLAIVAGASLIQQACGIVFCLLEDKLLLNFGSVTGTVAATALLIGLIVRMQLGRESNSQGARQAQLSSGKQGIQKQSKSCLLFGKKLSDFEASETNSK